MSRLDARAKATGAQRYVADLSGADPELAGRLELYFAALVRSTSVHARIVRVTTEEARALPGVIGVYVAADVADHPCGRALEDIPLLADDRVRFLGERIAAVVATSRQIAEAGAALVTVDYEELPAMVTIAAATALDATAIHAAPWSYDGAVIAEGADVNLIATREHGDRAQVEAILAECAFQIDETYRTQGVHQGYLEPQACIADYHSNEWVRLWFTHKATNRLRTMLGGSLRLAPEVFDVQPIEIGGDFGGKGAPGEAPLVVELSRLTGHPVKLVLRYGEDLIAGNPRHPAEIRVRMGCDELGMIRALFADITMNSGAYGGCTPAADGVRSAMEFPSYRTESFASAYRRVYTNTVHRGFMRAPGEAQSIFALESALDELATRAGIDPILFRRNNLLATGEDDAQGAHWVEHRGVEVLDAAVAAFAPLPVPEGWLSGVGMGIYSRSTPYVPTSLRLVPTASGGVCVEVGVVEVGGGSHTAFREIMSEALGMRPEQVEIRHVATSNLPIDMGVGGSRTTATFALAADIAAKAWHNRARDDEELLLEVRATDVPLVGSYCVQLAQVAVDPETGEMRVLKITSGVDVAAVINPLAHQMQIDGGTTMGLGYAHLEDLDEHDGHVWAANLGEYKLPSVRDTPQMQTVLVEGSVGVSDANVKGIGELTTPPTAPAIANALFQATGRRIRELPLTPERIFHAIHAD